MTTSAMATALPAGPAGPAAASASLRRFSFLAAGRVSVNRRPGASSPHETPPSTRLSRSPSAGPLAAPDDAPPLPPELYGAAASLGPPPSGDGARGVVASLPPTSPNAAEARVSPSTLAPPARAERPTSPGSGGAGACSLARSPSGRRLPPMEAPPSPLSRSADDSDPSPLHPHAPSGVTPSTSLRRISLGRLRVGTPASPSSSPLPPRLELSRSPSGAGSPLGSSRLAVLPPLELSAPREDEFADADYSAEPSASPPKAGFMSCFAQPPPSPSPSPSPSAAAAMDAARRLSQGPVTAHLALGDMEGALPAPAPSPRGASPSPSPTPMAPAPSPRDAPPAPLWPTAPGLLLSEPAPDSGGLVTSVSPPEMRAGPPPAPPRASSPVALRGLDFLAAGRLEARRKSTSGADPTALDRLLAAAGASLSARKHSAPQTTPVPSAASAPSSIPERSEPPAAVVSSVLYADLGSAVTLPRIRRGRQLASES